MKTSLIYRKFVPRTEKQIAKHFKTLMKGYSRRWIDAFFDDQLLEQSRCKFGPPSLRLGKSGKMKSGMKFNLTPEQEAHRIRRVQEALKGHSPTESQRIARSDGLRRAWAEGRIKPSGSPESRARAGAKMRGRKRPKDLVERIRLKNTGKKRTPECVAAMRQRLIEGYSAGKYLKPSPEALAERGRKISEALKGRRQTLEHRLRHSEVMRGRRWPRDVVERRAEPMRGRPQTAESTKIGPTNVGSLEGALRDPCGMIWPFRNLTHFVVTHPDLFEASDLIPQLIRGKPSRSCNASKRLLALFGRGLSTPGTWKGWTVVSETELGQDLLSRNVQQANPLTTTVG